ALAAGTPVLVSPAVDLAGAACAAGLGYTEPLDPAAWRERLAALLADPDALAAAGDRARGWGREHYAWGRPAPELGGPYRRGPGGLRGRGPGGARPGAGGRRRGPGCRVSPVTRTSPEKEPRPCSYAPRPPCGSASPAAAPTSRPSRSRRAAASSARRSTAT